ncbi:hypothetical protein PHMEG_00015055 [Phytophthora megakarya]|uniref:Chromo domain-containing protein n=1 Tax=Phytophthora megakarya TaxID=4795 RepID=A0A225W4T2_9STRA|nr:hypothetical protein PHMEG_00015055 [Phytophthora megakarya]
MALIERHDSFKIKLKVDEYAYELELPDRSGYRIYPVVHVSRMKLDNEVNNRPTTRFVPEIAKGPILDFDQKLLPGNPWVPDQRGGEYEVEAILDEIRRLSTIVGRSVRVFKVKWVGYEEPT